MPSVSDTFIQLNNGLKMPQLGLGVWKTPSGESCYNAVRDALDNGYVHIDTAKIYGNEADVGRAIRDSGIERKNIFVTTKLWNADQGVFADFTEMRFGQKGVYRKRNLARLEIKQAFLFTIYQSDIFPILA